MYLLKLINKKDIFWNNSHLIAIQSFNTKVINDFFIHQDSSAKKNKNIRSNNYKLII